MGFGDGFSKQYPGLENSGSTDIKVTGSLLVTGDLTVLGSSNIGGGGGGGDVYSGSINTFRADQIISGNLGVDGTITAKEFHVTYVTSSILYESGSTKFGNTPDDTHQFTGSVISSVGLTGSLSGTASYALDSGKLGGVAASGYKTVSSFDNYTGSSASTFAGTASYVQTASYATNTKTAQTASYVTTGAIDQFTTGVRNQFSAGDNIGITNGVISLSSSLSGLTTVTSSYFSGSFIGDGSQLSGISGLARTANIIYVNSGSAASAQNGSLLAPYKTIQAAHDYASSSIASGQPVIIDIAPGTYTENLTVTRHNTYFVANTNKAEGHSVTINGTNSINCSIATQKYNEIVGFEGILFNNNTNASSVTIDNTSGKQYTVYFKDCYFYNIFNGAAASALKSSANTGYASNKIILQNCIVNASGSGNILDFAGGDIKIDTLELYGAAGAAKAVYMSGSSVLAMDRALIATSMTQPSVYNISSYVTSSAVPNTLTVSNTSISSAGDVAVYTDKYALLWNTIFGGLSYKVSGSNPAAAVFYSNLTSVAKEIKFETVYPYPLYEKHGIIAASALSGNLSASYIQGILPVANGGTGKDALTSASILIGNGTDSITSLVGTSPADNGKVVTWVSGAFILTGSSAAGLNITPTAEGQTLISSGTTFVSARPKAGSNIGLDFDSGSITIKLSSSLDNLTSVSSSWFTGSLKGQADSALTASYVNPLTQSVSILGNLSASSGITGSFSGSGAGITGLTGSQINNFVTNIQDIAGAQGIRSIVAGDTPNTVVSNITITSGSAGQNATASLNESITLKDITLTGFIRAKSASFEFVENISASSLQVGEKYITLVSGGADHFALQGAGLLWGSGSAGPTSYTSGAIAEIIYNSGSDVLVANPGLSGSLSGSFKGDGSQLTGIKAENLSGIVKTLSSSSPTYISSSVNSNGTGSITLLTSSFTLNGVDISLGDTKNINLVQSITTTGSTEYTTGIYASSSSLSGAVNLSLSKSLSGFTSVSSSWFTGSLSGSALSAQTASYINQLSQSVYITGSLSASGNITGSNISASYFYGDGSNLTGIAATKLNLASAVPVVSGGTGLTSLTSSAILVGNGTGSVGFLSGTAPQNGYVATWGTNGFTLQQTSSGLPSTSGVSTESLLTISGSTVVWNKLSSSNPHFSWSFNNGTSSFSQSAVIPVVSGGLGAITQQSGALYILDTASAKFVPLTGSYGQTLAYDGNRWNSTDGFSRQIYTTATPALAAGQIVALSSSGLVAADSSDFLKSNAFGVVQLSNSSGYVIQTSNRVKVAFSSSTPAASVVTGSVFYVSSSGTASLYSDITGSPAGRYATQIGFLNDKVGTDHYIILQPRVFGLVY